MSAKTFSHSGLVVPNKISEALLLAGHIKRVAFVKDSYVELDKMRTLFLLPDESPSAFQFNTDIIDVNAEYLVSDDKKVYYQKRMQSYDDAVVMVQFNNNRIVKFMYDRANISGERFNMDGFRSKLTQIFNSFIDNDLRYTDFGYFKGMSEANKQMHFDNLITLMLGVAWTLQNIKQEFYNKVARELPHKANRYLIVDPEFVSGDIASALWNYACIQEESRQDGSLVPVIYTDIDSITNRYPRHFSSLLGVSRMECLDYYDSSFFDFYSQMFDYKLWVASTYSSRTLNSLAQDVTVVVVEQIRTYTDMTGIISTAALSGRSYHIADDRTGIPIDIVRNYFGIVQDIFTGKWVLDLYARTLAVTLPNGKSGSIHFDRRITSDTLLDLAFHECDYCGSRSYSDEDYFKEQVYDMYPEYIEVLEKNVADVDIVLDDLYQYIIDHNDEENPDYYCRECGMGYSDHEDEGGFSSHVWYAKDKLCQALAPFGKQAVTSYSYRDYDNFLNVADINEPKSIDPDDFMDHYFINSYHYSPAIDYLSTQDEDPEKDELLYLGLEWEMDGGGIDHQSAFVINSALSKNKHNSWTMRDGSLDDGIEIATMPATLNAHMNMFDYDSACAVASALDYRGHDVSTAGIHVHMSRRFFGKDSKIQMYKGALMALVMERNWDDFVKFSRRRYNRIEQWANKKDYLQALPANPTADDYQNVFNNKYGFDKYVALNTSKSATFEMRIFRSTLKASTIKATLQFAHNLAHWVKSHDLSDAQSVSFQDIIDYIPHKELSEYWQVAKEREVR